MAMISQTMVQPSYWIESDVKLQKIRSRSVAPAMDSIFSNSPMNFKTA